MTKQEMFTKAWLGLAGQNWEQSVLFGECMYRGPGGLKCAAGHLIPDEKYRSEMEYVSIPSLLEKYPFLLGKLLDDDHKEFLWQMQKAHDSNTALFIRAKMMDIAKANELVVPEVE
jgi:hypothetical protein